MQHTPRSNINTTKEFLRRGSGGGQGARNSGRCDFVGPVIHEFCKLKLFLRSSQMYEVYQWFCIIFFGSLYALAFFGPFSSGIPQP